MKTDIKKNLQVAFDKPQAPVQDTHSSNSVNNKETRIFSVVDLWNIRRNSRPVIARRLLG